MGLSSEQERLMMMDSSTSQHGRTAGSFYREGTRPSASSSSNHRASAPLISQEGVEHARKHAQSFALRVIWNNPQMEFVPATLYLKAAGEGLFLTLAIAWTLTYFFNPSIIQENPLKERLAYNNLCVGWDSPPANYVAVVLWIPISYLALRFCLMLHIQLQLEGNLQEDETPQWKYTFAYVSNNLFALAVCCFTLTLAISPFKSVWLHSLPFIFYIFARFMIILAMALLEWNNMSKVGRVFVYYYGFVSVALPLMYISEYAYYDMYGVRSPWPWVVTVIVDNSWFVCLALTSKMIPNTIVVHRVLELAAASSDSLA